jgi:hypothetical protein
MGVGMVGLFENWCIQPAARVTTDVVMQVSGHFEPKIEGPQRGFDTPRLIIGHFAVS